MDQLRPSAASARRGAEGEIVSEWPFELRTPLARVQRLVRRGVPLPEAVYY